MRNIEVFNDVCSEDIDLTLLYQPLTDKNIEKWISLLKGVPPAIRGVILFSEHKQETPATRFVEYVCESTHYGYQKEVLMLLDNDNDKIDLLLHVVNGVDSLLKRNEELHKTASVLEWIAPITVEQIRERQLNLLHERVHKILLPKLCKAGLTAAEFTSIYMEFDFIYRQLEATIKKYNI